MGEEISEKRLLPNHLMFKKVGQKIRSLTNDWSCGDLGRMVMEVFPFGDFLLPIKDIDQAYSAHKSS